MFHETFAARLGQVRESGRPLLDLTESDPARCGLGWDPGELKAIVGPGATTPESAHGARKSAGEAVASYLAGRGVSVEPDHIFFASSRPEVFDLVLGHLCRADEEVLVPSPSETLPARLAESHAVRVASYPLTYRGTWLVDRKALARAVNACTRAVLAGNPSQPTGAILTRDDLTFLDELCGERGLALIGDEAQLETALDAPASVLDARRAVAFHVSGLSGVCGLQGVVEWLAVSGPAEPAARAISALEQWAATHRPPPALPAIAGLLARREGFLERLRARLAANRAELASAALGERAWTLRWGRAGCWAVIEIGAAQDEHLLCLALLDDGVAVFPGSFFGLPRNGYLVASLLPPPSTFREALGTLDQRLRTPFVG